jgi:hypothetical protein
LNPSSPAAPLLLVAVCNSNNIHFAQVMYHIASKLCFLMLFGEKIMRVIGLAMGSHILQPVYLENNILD